jgi:hypothetical protein
VVSGLGFVVQLSDCIRFFCFLQCKSNCLTIMFSVHQSFALAGPRSSGGKSLWPRRCVEHSSTSSTGNR